MDNPVQMWLTVLKRILVVRDNTLSWCVMRECGPEPLQVNWFRATMRFYNSLTQCNSTTAKQVLHADMRLSSRSDDWSSHIISAMTVLIQEYLFKDKLRNCEPIDLSHFAVDLRERDTWSFGHPTLMAAQESTTAKFSLITDGAHYPQKKPWLLVLPTALPSNVPRPPTRRHCSVARFRLRVHTLCFETATWNPTSFPTCDLCEADDMSRMNSMLFPTAQTSI